MIRLLHKEIDVEHSEELLHLPLTQESDLESLELASGEWKIENHGLVGRFRGNGGGICYTKSSFPGDILISFYGTMVAPCRNDLNFVLKAEGWNYERNDAARGFIGGLNGWYGQKAEFGRIGLGTYCSQIRFRDHRIYRPSWQEIRQSYTAQF